MTGKHILEVRRRGAWNIGGKNIPEGRNTAPPPAKAHASITTPENFSPKGTVFQFS